MTRAMLSSQCCVLTPILSSSSIRPVPRGRFPLVGEADLVNATHMSHHLHNAFLSCTMIWSHLDFKHEMGARVFRTTEAQTSLHIGIPMDTTQTMGSLAELRQQ